MHGALLHYCRGDALLVRLPAETSASADGAAEVLRRLADDRHAAWLVLCREWDDDPHGFVLREIEAMRRAPAARLPGVRIYRLGG
jgi:hypothetical protein